MRWPVTYRSAELKMRLMPSLVTSNIASMTIERLIFQTPCSRSMKVIGTSMIRALACSDFLVIST